MRLADREESWHEKNRQLVPRAQLDQRKAANSTQAAVPDEMLHTPFLAQASRKPHQTAVVAPGRTLSYGELSRLASRLGADLQRIGARPNTLVAVVAEKGLEQIVAVLGTLLSGAAYLPIDTGFSEERIRQLLADGEVRLVVTQSHLDREIQWPEGIQRLCVDDLPPDEASAREFVPRQRPEDLAYVIYTSGSSGVPKGVMIEHRQAVNTVLDINRRFGVGPGDRVLALSSLSFDLSVYDIFGALAAGAAIVIPDASTTRDPAHWANLVAREEVTIWNSVPFLMHLLAEHLSGGSAVSLDSLRLVLLSGDWIPLGLPEEVRSLAAGAQVISLGGATEASIWSIFYPVERTDPNWKSIPYGRPLTNQSFHVLNEALEPCPTWVPGDLYIGGAGLARGYWRDQEKTSAQFLTHPETGERLYRTGDRGRYLPDANIEFLGREDLQLKIQGYRVEIGEIEAVLAQHPGLSGVAVTASGPPDGNKHLHAYVVSGQGPAPRVDDLRSFLEARLPAYMVPSTFTFLEALPLSANGKLDRNALPAPVSAEEKPSLRELPAEEAADIVRRISTLVASVLAAEDFERHTNLLSLGANSVDVIRIVNLLDKEMRFRPDIDDFYRTPTVIGLAHSYQARQPRSADVEPVAQPAAGFDVLLDPEEREAFRDSQPGLRHDLTSQPGVTLPQPAPPEHLEQRFIERRSYREFLERPVPNARFGKLIGSLRQILLDGKAKYQYPSAGGLYPVQTYVHVKQGRVEGVSSGVYYYHPADHRLQLVATEAGMDRSIHSRFVNRPIYDSSAFGIFLIAQLEAIRPMYGEQSDRFATLEAGYMSQLLMLAATECEIGGTCSSTACSAVRSRKAERRAGRRSTTITIRGRRPRRRGRKAGFEGSVHPRPASKCRRPGLGGRRVAALQRSKGRHDGGVTL
jgi:amino acid adenylation domain-containing protein